MQGLWLDGRLQLRDDLPIPRLDKDEALVRIRMAGICGTDLELIKGYRQFTGILGHEFVGEISDAPNDLSRVGERVVGEINIVCGVCQFCRCGQRSHCEQRDALGIQNRDGAFAEYLRLPLKNLIPIPETLPDEAAVFTEPLAAALEISEQVTICPTDHVLLIGAGRIGQLIAQTLRLTGCNLVVIARYKKQRKLLEANTITCTDEGNLSENTFDIVVEATGSSEGLALARRSVRPRGTIILKSTYQGDYHFDFSSLVVDEITVVGSRCGPFRPAVCLLATNLVDPSPLIDAQFPLDQALQALEKAREPGVLKILLQVGDKSATI